MRHNPAAGAIIIMLRSLKMCQSASNFCTQNNNQSLQDVADAVGVSKAHIWELEPGRTDNPSMALVTRLADHFGVSVSFLVDEDLNAPDADTELQRMFRQAKKLNPTERAILDDMVQSLLKRRSQRAK